MRTIAILSMLVAASLACPAFAQQAAERKLPPGVNPVSLSRLPPLTRDDLDAEGES